MSWRASGVKESTVISAAATQLRSVTIFVPALNEAQNIRLTIEDLIGAAQKQLDSFEILIFNDGSTDGTTEIIDELAKEHESIRAIHHQSRQGLAINFHKAIAMATKKNITIVPGDGAFRIDGIETMFEAVGEADMVLGYRTNMRETRSIVRFVVSRFLTHTSNLLYGLKLKDVHCLCVFPVEQLRKLTLIATNNGFFVEVLVKLLRLRLSYVVVPMPLNPEYHVFGRSLLEFKSVGDLLKILMHLVAFPKRSS